MRALISTSLVVLCLATIILAEPMVNIGQSDFGLLGVGAHSTPTSPAQCSSYLYAPQCVANTKCGWCCNVTAVNDWESTAFSGYNCVDLTLHPAAYAQCGFYATNSPLMLTRHVFPNLTTVAPTSTTPVYFPPTSDVILSGSTPPPTPTPSTTVAPMSTAPSCTANVCNMITTELFGQSTCSRCVASGSCYYCLSLKQCVGGRQYCPGGEIVNTCSMPPTSTPSTGLFGISLTTGAIIFVIVAFVTIAGCGGLVIALKLRRSWRERRIEEERARRLLAAQTAAAAAAEAAANPNANAATTTTATTEPAATSSETPAGTNPSNEAAALATANEAPETAKDKAGETKEESSSSSEEEEGDADDDEDVCALCYERPPTIAFLPCYHANFCQECCERIRPAGGTYACPNCRQPVVAMVNFTQRKPLVAGGSSATTIPSQKK